jgi:TM2 domain-containing membrane protein YozV
MKSKNTAVLLGLLGGIVGAHRFYLGQTFRGIICIPFGLFTGPVFAIKWLFSSREAFDNKYNNQRIQREQMNIQKEMLKAIKNK